ncbi:acyl dehydratase [Alicyclobacillus sacchari]|uniref:Acyl dehydratase n=1 Tax=Alicyclobacillus sacchari TaxID=392010 RepID=A0A4R8LM06_9BACL|nr:MaoC/PaaZ C-terminal domain-containing protein [Alicyclobacillus sacchari]TDY46337.1 acyl dehydratase [Alicyclobacillus sacchari]GMA57146.1 MaoC family dehydratase [Alicyclobacillus sacchari]
MTEGMRFAVGDRLAPLTKPPVTRTQLVMYSGASGDFNPIHTVESFAQEAGLGGVIAHGMLTMAFVGQMLTDLLGECGELETFGIRFIDMVRPDDIITCEGIVTEVEEDADGQIVACDIWAKKTPSGEKVVQGTARFRTFR